MPERTPTHINGKPLRLIGPAGCSAAALYLRAFPAIDQLDLTIPIPVGLTHPPFEHHATLSLQDATAATCWQGTVTAQRLTITPNSRYWSISAHGISWHLEQHIAQTAATLPDTLPNISTFIYYKGKKYRIPPSATSFAKAQSTGSLPAEVLTYIASDTKIQAWYNAKLWPTTFSGAWWTGFENNDPSTHNIVLNKSAIANDPKNRAQFAASDIDGDGMINAREAIESQLAYAASQGVPVSDSLQTYEGPERIPAISTTDNTIANQLWSLLQWMPHCRLVFTPTYPAKASILDIRSAQPLEIPWSADAAIESLDIQARYDLVRDGIEITTVEDRSLLLDKANILATDPVTGSHYRRTLRTKAGDPVYGTVTTDVAAIMSEYSNLVSWVQALKYDGSITQRLPSIPVPSPLRITITGGLPQWANMLAPWQETSLDLLTGQRTITFAADSSLSAADFSTLNEALTPRTTRDITEQNTGGTS